MSATERLRDWLDGRASAFYDAAAVVRRLSQRTIIARPRLNEAAGAINNLRDRALSRIEELHIETETEIERLRQQGIHFQRGDHVEKYTGDAPFTGTVVASHLTLKGKARYVVEVDGWGGQMIESNKTLRKLAEKTNG